MHERRPITPIPGEPTSDTRPLKVLIVGGGCAALEAAFRLQRIAGERVDTTILAPDEHLVTHALEVLVPFAAGHVPQEPLAALASDAGARLRRGRMISVDPARHRVLTGEGEEIVYDALLIAVGAVKRAPWSHVLAFGSPGAEERMHGLVQDLEAGYIRRIAFVVPVGASWPVPLYELALMAGERAYDMGLSTELTVVTDEAEPLEVFGREASRALAERLAQAGVAVRTGVRAHVPRFGLVELHPGDEQLTVDRIVTLPATDGPNVRGLPGDARGFLPVDRHGRVSGVPDVYAAGDATQFPIKQGGLACQQADAAAEAIAAQAGAAIEPQPYPAVLQGVLLTERDETFMRRDAGVPGNDSSTGALWWPPTKIAGRELSRHIGGLPRHASDPSATWTCDPDGRPPRRYG
jgi:sulfide:quinone oxidoreductase